MAIATDTQIQNLVQLATSGDSQARELLLLHTNDRLMRLTRKMLRGYPKLRRWEQTDDVCQNAMLRLHRALDGVEIESAAHFFNLAATQIRRELCDLARRHFGPQGGGANHHTDHAPSDEAGGTLANRSQEPHDLQSWTEFHQQIENLPDDQREVFNLVWYEGLTQEEAAEAIGISLRTLKRRWQSARLLLHERLTS